MKFDLDPDEESEGVIVSRAWIGRILSQSGVTGFTARLSGSGDSGDLDEIDWEGADGSTIKTETVERALKAIILPFGISRIQGGSETILDAINSMIMEDTNIHGGWENNNGGCIESRYVIHENGIETEYCSFSEYDDDDEDYDIDEDMDDDEPDDELQDDLEP